MSEQNELLSVYKKDFTDMEHGKRTIKLVTKSGNIYIYIFFSKSSLKLEI